MATTIQIVLDCGDSVKLAQWWAKTLDWKFEWLEPTLYEKLKADGYCTETDVIDVEGKLSWATGAAINSGEDSNPRQRMYFQNVPEQKVIKNRMHIDVQVGPLAVNENVGKLVGRGATQVGDGSQGPHHWVVMTDPEGNEFCVS